MRSAVEFFVTGPMATQAVTARVAEQPLKHWYSFLCLMLSTLTAPQAVPVFLHLHDTRCCFAQVGLHLAGTLVAKLSWACSVLNSPGH